MVFTTNSDNAYVSNIFIDNFQWTGISLVGVSNNMTFKNIMLRSLASFKCNDGEKAMNVMAIGVKLSTCAGDVWEYNDSENNTDAILKEVINMNQFQLSSAILGQLYMKVKTAEAFK